MTEDDKANLEAQGMEVVQISPAFARALEGSKLPDDLAPPEVFTRLKFAASFTPKAANDTADGQHLLHEEAIGRIAHIGGKFEYGTITLQIAGGINQPNRRVDLTPGELALLIGLGQRLLAGIVK